MIIMFEYLIWLLAFVALPILILYFSFKKILNKHKKIFAIVAILSVIFAPIWDVIAVWLKVWYFPSGKNLGILILNFPFEEILFMIFVSVWISVLTVVMRYRK